MNKQFRKLTLLVILCATWIVNLHALDSTEATSGKLHFDVEGGYLYQAGSDFTVKFPDAIADGPRGFRLSDNPILHAAGWLDLDLSYQFVKGVNLRAGLLGEHRGMSYGVYNSKSIVAVPHITLSIDTAVTILRERIGLGMIAGNFDDIRLHEGLRFYNMDVQGLRLYAQWQHYILSLNRIGDLLSGEGLDINDAITLDFEVEALELWSGLTLDLDLGLVWDPNRRNDDSLRLNTVYSVGLNHPAGLRLYGELAIRSQSEVQAVSAGAALDFASRSAFVGGLHFNAESDALRIDARAEYRRYGRSFNLGYKNQRVRYRSTDPDDYPGTIGDQLYPLSHYLRPFSKWAAYTEYQSANVATALLQADLRYVVFGDVFFDAKADINLIMVEDNDSFVYPFYDIGIGWQPVNGFELKLSRTNRGMNLDRHYPTLYQLEHSSLLVSARWKLGM